MNGRHRVHTEKVLPLTRHFIMRALIYAICGQCWSIYNTLRNLLSDRDYRRAYRASRNPAQKTAANQHSSQHIISLLRPSTVRSDHLRTIPVHTSKSSTMVPK